MKRLMLIPILIASFAAFVPTLVAQDINLANLSADDVKAIRKIIADRDFEKGRADEAIKQRDYWKTSAAEWKVLFESEKARADGIQEQRIDAVKNAVAEMQKANKLLHDQAEADRKKIGEQQAKIISLKSDRKWWVSGGAVAGAAATFLIIRALDNNNIPVPGFAPTIAQSRQVRFSIPVFKF